MLALAAAPSAAAAGPKANPRISPYDLATRDDLLLAHLLRPATAGDVPQWSKALLAGLPGSGRRLGQPLLRGRRPGRGHRPGVPGRGPAVPSGRSTDVVAGGAAALGVEKPEVHVRNSPLTRALRRPGRRPRPPGPDQRPAGTSSRAGPTSWRSSSAASWATCKCGHDGLRRKAYAVLAAVRADRRGGRPRPLP